MRVRTGHRPSDWSENQPANGYHVSLGTGGFLQLGGEVVAGEHGKVERDRRINREKAQRKAAKA